MLPFLFAVFAGFLEGYAPDIFGENGSLGQIPTFIDLLNKMYIYISLQIILYGNYIFLVLGTAFLILLIKLLAAIIPISSTLKSIVVN